MSVSVQCFRCYSSPFTAIFSWALIENKGFLPRERQQTPIIISSSRLSLPPIISAALLYHTRWKGHYTFAILLLLRYIVKYYIPLFHPHFRCCCKGMRGRLLQKLPFIFRTWKTGYNFLSKISGTKDMISSFLFLSRLVSPLSYTATLTQYEM